MTCPQTSPLRGREASFNRSDCPTTQGPLEPQDIHTARVKGGVCPEASQGQEMLVWLFPMPTSLMPGLARGCEHSDLEGQPLPQWLSPDTGHPLTSSFLPSVTTLATSSQQSLQLLVKATVSLSIHKSPARRLRTTGVSQ